MQIRSRKYAYFLIFLGILSLFPNLLAQEIDVSALSEEDDARREEIQRYFGYEDLLFRYLTLPYDVSANVNQQGKYVETGFVLFTLVPITLLFLLYQRKKWFYGTMAALVIYLSLCLRFSFLFDVRNLIYNPITDVGNNLILNPRWDGTLLEPVYIFMGWLGKPIYLFMRPLTGQQDHVTNPVMALILLLMVVLIGSVFGNRLKYKIVGLIGFTFAWLWWMLSGGIIWYGFLIFPLGYLLIGYGLQKKKLTKKQESLISIQPVFQNLALGVIITWLFLSFVSRISNVSVLMESDHPDLGKMVVDSRIFPYTVGMIGERASVDISARNIHLALERINSDSSLIYQVGTSLSFEVSNNHLRCYEDNNLSYFYFMINRYKDKKTFIDVLKANGFKYIIIDLMLPTVDRTPEQSLREKYSLFMGQIIANNPDLQLLATDRLIRTDAGNGTKREVMGVFGQDIGAFGSYAVYEIF